MYGIGAAIWLILSLILSIVGGIVIYFVFLSKKNEGKFQGFLGWLYDFLSFKKMFLEVFLKIAYICTALYFTLSSFTYMAIPGMGFLIFLLVLVLGNVLARVLYEFALVKLIICRNTTEINQKLSAKNINVEDKK